MVYSFEKYGYFKSPKILKGIIDGIFFELTEKSQTGLWKIKFFNDVI
jgi:hypothetical protein